MRIVFDGRTIADRFPGVGRYAYELVKALADTGGGDDLVVLHDAGARNTRFDIDGLARRANVRLVATSLPALTLGGLLGLGRQVRRLAAEVAHFPSFDVPFGTPRPSVVTVHDALPLHSRAGLGVPRRLAFTLLCRRAVRAAAGVICTSHAAAAEVCGRLGADPAKVAVVPMGVAERFRPAPAGAVARVRAVHGLPERYTLHLGVNRPHKNLALLVAAFAALGPEFEDVDLVLAGDRDPRFEDAGAVAAAARLGRRVRTIGRVAEDDLPALYTGAACFAFPSSGEGFGLPVLEAMACGTPVVCAADGGLSEVAGGAALAVPPDDARELAAALAAVLGDGTLRGRLVAAGRARAVQLRWPQAAALTREVYARALHRVRAATAAGGAGA